MRVLLCGLNSWPEPIGVGRFTGELAEHFVQQGHSVRVVAAPPYYPHWRVFDGYRALRYKTEERHGVFYHRCPVWVPAQPSGLKRMLHLASFSVSSFPVLLWHAVKWRPDLVIAVEPTLLAAPGAWLTGRLGRARVWLHVQDLEVEAAFELGLVRGECLRRILSGAERWLLRRFDLVSTISPRMKDKIVAKGLRKEKVTVLPNWADTEQIHPLLRQSWFRRELGLRETDTVVLYAGNMNAKQGLDTVIESARLLRGHERVRFVLAGEGPGRQALERESADLTNVRLLPLQPLAQLNELLNLADIHVLPQRAGAADLMLPSKLGGMLASGRPIIAAAVPGTQLWDSVQDCGLTVLPEDPAALAAAIRELSDDEDSRKRLGTNARRRATQQWSRERTLRRAEQQVSVLGARPAARAVFRRRGTLEQVAGGR